MLEPSSKKEVQSFIGMINYLSKFSARLSELSEPIQELSKERVSFNWGPEHRESFDAKKKELVKAPILAYYIPNKEMVLQTDASIKGLGVCLLQHGKPVYSASKALTENQKGYIAIKLESLTVAWAMEKIPVWHPYHFRNRSKTSRGNTFKESEPGNNMIAENPHPNIPIPFYCAPYSGTNESIN